MELSRHAAVTSASATTSRGLNSNFRFPKCLCLFIFQTLWEKTPAIAALLLLQAGKSAPQIQSIKGVTLSFLALLTCLKWSKLEPYSASHRNYPAPGAWGAFNGLWKGFTLPERREPGQEHTVSRNKGKVMKATIAKIHNSVFCLFSERFAFPIKSGMFEYTNTFTPYFPQTEANKKYQSDFGICKIWQFCSQSHSSIKGLETKSCFNYSGTARIHSSFCGIWIQKSVSIYKEKWNLPAEVKLPRDVQESFSDRGTITKDKIITGAKLPEIAKKVVLQSLPVNAWLLWRFVLQSHQFWLGIKSQKKKQKNKAELFKAISSQLFASSVEQLCHAQYKHPKRGKTCK